MKIKMMIAVIALSFVASSVFAWDGSGTGKVDTISVSNDVSYTFRVSLLPQSPLCGTTNTFAYLNDGETGYKTFVGTLMLAKALGSSVTLYTTRDASGYCHLGYVSTQ
jgi:hypothetical protein